MLTITNQSREFTDIEKYLMTASPDVKSMKNVADGTEITITGIIEFNDDGDGKKEPSDIMSVITPDLTAFAFQSATLKRTIRQLQEIFKGRPFTIVKTTGTSKAGREYVNAVLKLNIEKEVEKAKALMQSKK